MKKSFKKGDIVIVSFPNSDDLSIGEVQRDTTLKDSKEDSIKFEWVVDTNKEFHKDIIAFVNSDRCTVVNPLN